MICLWCDGTGYVLAFNHRVRYPCAAFRCPHRERFLSEQRFDAWFRREVGPICEAFEQQRGTP